MNLGRLSPFLAAFVVLSLVAAACGDDSEAETPEAETPEAETPEAETPEAETPEAETPEPELGYAVRNVPGDYATIQEAVDAAVPGDLILLEEGVYHEAVVVQTENVVIRGVDRNKVIIDGEHAEGFENGIVAVVNGVAIENLTVRNYTGNGIFWTGDYGSDIFVDGWRASYVTVHNVGDYGVYAFNAVNGQIDNSFGAAAADSPFYVGQCKPCNALVYKVEGTTSQLGYSGTNSSGTTVAASWFHDNSIGIVNNSSDGEELSPHGGSLIIGNLVENNTLREVPGKNDTYQVGLGAAIVMAGTQGNTIERNTIVGHDRAGVIIVDWVADILGGSTDFHANDNIVRDNFIDGSVLDADLLLALADPEVGGHGNCFAGNSFGSSIPAEIETVLPCDGEDTADMPGLAELLTQFNLEPWEFSDYATLPAPDYDFDNMPGDPRTDPPRPAIDVPMDIDLDAIVAPDPSP